MLFRVLRIFLSGLFFVAFLSGFIVHFHLFESISFLIASWQFFPAVISITKSGFLVAALIVILILTILFGRIYCSTICPLGTAQDFFGVFSKKKRKFSSPSLLMRYAIPLISILFFVFGISVLIEITEPYSILSRSVIYVSGLSGYELKGDAFHIGIISLIIFCAIIVLSFFKGRYYCNSFCPTGAILSLFAYFPVFALRINKNKCVSCGKCVQFCKAECIDTKTKKIDNSRCVSCFNCIGKCNFKAIDFSLFTRPKPSDITSKAIFESRRSIISLIVLGILLYPFSRFLHAKNSNLPIVPPGSGSIKHFTENCTSCHLCVSQCPTKVLKPSLFEYGIAGFMQPKLDYNSGYCDYNCNICNQICPAKAIKPVSLSEKQNVSIGLASIDERICIPYAKGTACAACDEMCPTGATHMITYKNGLPAPKVDKDICIGCGACEKACPVLPDKAIIVKSREIHTQIDPLKSVNKKSKDNIQDFAF